MNFGQISGHLPGFAHFQKPGFDQQKPSIYAGLRVQLESLIRFCNSFATHHAQKSFATDEIVTLGLQLNLKIA